MSNILNTGNWLNQSNLPEVGWLSNSNWNRYDRGPVIANALYAIRIANNVISRIEAGETAALTEDQEEELLGQAYFFRAWYYFQVIRRWGGMPLLDKAFASNDDLDLVRLTYSESTEWLLTDLDRAIELLPDAWGDIEFGRATKGAALAIKSMATLYAASPLMQNDTNSIQYLNYSQAWSERAAEYANDALQYINSGAGGFRLMSGAEYENIFYHQGIRTIEYIHIHGLSMAEVNTQTQRDFPHDLEHLDTAVHNDAKSAQNN